MSFADSIPGKLFNSVANSLTVSAKKAPSGPFSMLLASPLFSRNHPVLSMYAYNGSVLCLKLCAVGIITTFQGKKRQGTLNQYRRGQLWQAEVEFTNSYGWLNFLHRAQVADLQVIPTHLIISLLYLKTFPHPDDAALLFGTFTVSRLLCSLGLLPRWMRTLASIVSLLDTGVIALMVFLHFAPKK